MRRIMGVLMIVMLCVCAVGAAEDNCYVVPVRDITVTEGQLPDRLGWRAFRRRGHHIRVRLDSDAEAYLESARNFREESRLAVRIPDELPVSGRIFFPAEEGEGTGDIVAFQISREIEAGENSRREFLDIKGGHYKSLLNEDIPGAA